MVDELPLVAIVEDEESIRKALLRLFRLNHYRVNAFASPLDYLRFSSEHKPDCIVLDLQLPGMTGMDLLRHLSDRENAPPVVVITGDIESKTREQCMALGTRCYFRKPVDSKMLLESVGDIVSPAA